MAVHRRDEGSVCVQVDLWQGVGESEESCSNCRYDDTTNGPVQGHCIGVLTPAALEQEGFLSHPRIVESAQGAWMTVDGKRVFNLCTNNYLGLANHPHLREAAHTAIERFGVGPAAVRSIAGTSKP